MNDLELVSLAIYDHPLEPIKLNTFLSTFCHFQRSSNSTDSKLKCVTKHMHLACSYKSDEIINVY